jgi:hypothetical protein
MFRNICLDICLEICLDICSNIILKILELCFGESFSTIRQMGMFPSFWNSDTFGNESYVFITSFSDII